MSREVPEILWPSAHMILSDGSLLHWRADRDMPELDWEQTLAESERLAKEYAAAHYPNLSVVAIDVIGKIC